MCIKMEIIQNQKVSRESRELIWKAVVNSNDLRNPGIVRFRDFFEYELMSDFWYRFFVRMLFFELFDT